MEVFLKFCDLFIYFWSSLKFPTTLAPTTLKIGILPFVKVPPNPQKLMRPQIFIPLNSYQRTQQTTHEISETFHRPRGKLKAAKFFENKTKP